ncbi:methyltransferase domain-containing protein [Plantactinospora solaniradicis]|uniref:Methyltransferase domain-containing protein n=1 Tax=Plantactinospora solaniradicis TaxID=1723736 RepID=A0ABW1KSF5_9ACTN
MTSLWKLIGERIPDDHSRQVTSVYYLRQSLTAPDAPSLLVDLGCGYGESAALTREIRPGTEWIGVDIYESEPAKTIVGEKVLLYDGVNLPFDDESIPLIYTNQVMEHVRHPEALLKDIHRVLTPGGVFIGSTSQLEPYHAWSFWNYTVYGFKTIVEDAGLILEEIRPGIDGISLVQRHWFGKRQEHGAWFKRSPLNIETDQWGAETKRRPALVNLRKLHYAGQFSYRVRKPGGASAEPGSLPASPPEAEGKPPLLLPMEPIGTPAQPPERAKPTMTGQLRRRAGRIKRRLFRR